MAVEIKCNNLDFWYPPEENAPIIKVLSNINLNISQGEFIAVIGHNGSGKSTLAKHFNAILLPMGGEVLVGDISTKEEKRIFEIRQKVGMVFQNPDNQIVASIVEDDIAFAPENLGVPREEIRRRVDFALKAVDMYDYREHSASQLSGGQKQRIAIAGVIAMQPDVIVLDEPTAMLDPKGRKEVIRTIKSLCKNTKISIVLITHYMNETVNADRVIVMDKGEICFSGSPKEVFARSAELREIGLETPQVTAFTEKLQNLGVKIPAAITVSECVDSLCKLLEE